MFTISAPAPTSSRPALLATTSTRATFPPFDAARAVNLWCKAPASSTSGAPCDPTHRCANRLRHPRRTDGWAQDGQPPLLGRPRGLGDPLDAPNAPRRLGLHLQLAPCRKAASLGQG